MNTTARDGQRVSDIAPTTLRLPPALRTALQREAAINGRSLSQEIITRLLESVQPATGHPTVLHTGERLPAAPQPSDAQRRLVVLFNALSPEQQLALLTLIGP